MHTFVAAGAGFLLAVLWFDLMFDVQTRKHTAIRCRLKYWRRSRHTFDASRPTRTP